MTNDSHKARLAVLVQELSVIHEGIGDLITLVEAAH